MLNTRRRRHRAAAALALLLVAGAVVTILLSRSATPAPAGPLTPRFAVLRPATSAAMDALSPEAKMRLHYMASNPRLPGPGPVSKVGVVRRANGRDVTVAAIGGAICAFLAHGIGGCDDVRRVVAGQSFGAEPIRCRGYRVLGVVPDGISRIAVDSGDDGSVDVTLPVISNVYLGILEPAATVATGLDTSGNPRFKVEFPLDYYASTQRTTSGANC